jgi:hypothetical protein
MVHQPIDSNILTSPDPELAVICGFDSWMLLQTPVIPFGAASEINGMQLVLSSLALVSNELNELWAGF